MFKILMEIFKPVLEVFAHEFFSFLFAPDESTYVEAPDPVLDIDLDDVDVSFGM